MAATKKTMLPSFLAVLCFLFSFPVDASGRTLRLATTTSTENSGLFDHILPDFEKSTGIKVNVIAVGTGKALKLAEQGDVDAVLVHARKLEQEFVAKGYGVRRKKVMENDFLIVGPPADPSMVKNSGNVREAMRRLKSCNAPFISRGDGSGTHVRELSLWDLVGGPPGPPCRLEVGQGQAALLRIAMEKQAYALTDKATYLAVKGISESLKPVFEGGEMLVNPYSIILVNPKKYPGVDFDAAVAFQDWFLSPKTQKIIANFKVKGVILFRPVVK